MKLPKLVRVRQHFESTREEDVAAAVHRELEKLNLSKKIEPGQSVALTAGSRGIANIDLILRETVSHLRSLGAEPFVVPTMGSHGGGTAEGQRRILESYGITEKCVGAPIRSSMEVVEIGRNEFDVPIHLDREASRADHIGVVARVKPHTGFEGRIESGLCKMMMIGLGKHVGAGAYHTALLAHPWEPFVSSVVKVMIANAPIRFGLGIVENAEDQTAKITGALPEEFFRSDEELLILARQWMPRLPFSEADLLIIEEIGKEISGTGLDTNVVGRKNNFGRRQLLPIRRIFVRGLSERTHGNATGIGFADFTTRRLVESMDYDATIINCLTASFPAGANIPVYFDSDRQAIETALKTVGPIQTNEAKITQIRNTLQLSELLVSTSYDLEQAHSKLEVLGPARFDFDADGNLLECC